MHSLLKTTLATAVVAGVATVTLTGYAQTNEKFPSKPIRFVTGGAGSQNDIVTRLIGSKLSESFGQPVVVENRAGGGGAIPMALVAKAAPDGYTLLLLSAQFAIGAALRKDTLDDALRDFAGVTRIGFSTQVLVVPASLGVKSFKDFVAFAQASPKPILLGSGGAGTGGHMDGERFRLATGIKATHVGFKDAPEMLIQVLTGRVHYAVAGLGPALPLIKDGRVIALAVMTPQRSPLMPEVPAIVEILPGYERGGSYGLIAPARTPLPVLDQLAGAVARILELTDVKDRMDAFGFVPAPSTPAEHDRILRADIESYSRIAKLVGLRAQ